jgi:tripartite-type tricarboxylate transporter receptor subunit TctC
MSRRDMLKPKNQRRKLMDLMSLSKATAFVCALVLLGTRIVAAQTDYPNRVVTIYVGFAAGGSTDVIARFIAQKFGEYTDQKFLVVNVPGAATALSAEKVAQSDADGYTLYVTNSSTFGTNPNYYSKLKYSLADFQPITLITRVPLTLDVGSKFAGSDLKDFIAQAKKKPGGMTFGTSGPGSFCEILNSMASGILGFPVVNVPYRGGGPAVVDLKGGVLDGFFDNLSTSLPLFGDGSIRALAISSRDRSPLAPDIPTFYELGFKEYVIENLFAMLAPKGTPRPIVDKLNSLFRRAVDDPQFKSSLEKIGVVPEASTPEETKKALQDDKDLVATMMKRYDIKPIN